MKSSLVSGENRGSVNNILLKALQSGDKYGYEINKEIETKSNGQYFLKEASLYSGLKRLQAGGYITSYWQNGDLGIRRHYYSITQKGINKLNNSNFSWDESKEFLEDFFNKESPKNFAENNITKDETNFVEEKTDLKENLNLEQESNVPHKKNPFAIEVNPLQQSIFDFGINNSSLNNKDNIANKEELTSEDNKIFGNTKTLENSDDITENKQVEAENKKETLKENIIDDKINNDDENLVLEKNKDDEILDKTSPSYADLINSYSSKSYSSNLNKTNNLDIFSLLNKDEKENTNSIVFDNSTPKKEGDEINLEKLSNEQSEVKLNEETEQKLNNSDKIDENTLEQKENNINENVLNLEQKEEIKPFEKADDEKSEKIDLQNIFGSLLLKNESENKNLDNNLVQQTINIDSLKTEDVEEPHELPRINIEDNINITLGSKFNRPKKEYERPLMSGTNNIPSVKQYVNELHRKALITNATKIDDEVNLEGINVKEYTKINNKLIKNPSYIYINKLNMFLSSLTSILLIIESILFITILSSQKTIGAFEIVFYSLAMLFAVCFISFNYKNYIKDKFKVGIRKYNFKNSLFYSVLIFIVSLVIIICINIFLGMTANSISDFILKLVLEIVVCLNLVMYPIIKYLFYRFNKFAN